MKLWKKIKRLFTKKLSDKMIKKRKDKMINCNLFL